MLALEIDFLVDRYHATPWGRAANEGQPEWPPSPWRLGRALASAWWRSEVAGRACEADIDALLTALAPPPRFLLPRAIAAHSRHYMPTGSLENGELKTTLILDPFVRTDGVSALIVWDDLELDEPSRRLLNSLLESIGYLGRAESPCLLRLVPDLPFVGDRIEVLLLQEDEQPHASTIVQLLCLAERPRLEALSESTAERRKRRIASPPDGRFLPFVLPREALEPRGRRPRRRPDRTAIALRFALDGQALPPLAEALRLADRFRAAALKRAGGRELSSESVARLRGRDPATGELGRGNRHAHYLSTDENGDGRLDHLTVYCSDLLSPGEIAALALSRLNSWAFDYPLHLLLLQELRLEELPGPGPLAAATCWRSHTPFLPPRHVKRRAGRLVEAFEDQVTLELRRRGLPEPAAVTRLRPERHHWGTFRRSRSGVGWEGGPAVGFELEFASPVQGPIALGRNSHFGMGLFLPS